MTTLQSQFAVSANETHTTASSTEVRSLQQKGARRKAVVVHAGARDNYQLAIALSENGILEALVTDLFWPKEKGWARLLGRLLPRGAMVLLSQRSASVVPAMQVQTCVAAGIKGLLMHRVHFLPFFLRRRMTRTADATLGRTAGKLAKYSGTAIISYSYYAYDAFLAYGQAGLLFQMHPHPATMRRLLSEELEMHPDCADSLRQEWELALPEDDFRRLVSESAMASHFLVASTFTRNSLIEHGVAHDSIDVIPYGVDLHRFTPVPRKARREQGPLHLLFVGRINQRKGLKYLLEALRLLDSKRIKLTICGRVLDDLAMFAPFGAQVEIRASVTADELVAAYQAADLFVFPSVGEGFGQVLLEALACGLPILATTHTAAPDIVEDGVQGFVVEPRRADLLADRIAWALHHPRDLAIMGRLARERAETFTWQRFRTAAAASVSKFLEQDSPAPEMRTS